MFYAKVTGGGNLPNGLKGIWTHENDLQARINAHYVNKEKVAEAKPKITRTRKTTPKKEG